MVSRIPAALKMGALQPASTLLRRDRHVVLLRFLCLTPLRGSSLHGRHAPRHEPISPFDRRSGLSRVGRHPASAPSAPSPIRQSPRGYAPWNPSLSAIFIRRVPRGKELKIQGVERVRARRNPTLTFRVPAPPPSRFAERRIPGSLPQEPPRRTRREHSPPCVHALPSLGAPA